MVSLFSSIHPFASLLFFRSPFDLQTLFRTDGYCKFFFFFFFSTKTMGAKRRKSHICSSFPLPSPFPVKMSPTDCAPLFEFMIIFFFLKERNGKIPFWHFYCELIAFPLVGGMRLKVNEYRDTQ